MSMYEDVKAKAREESDINRKLRYVQDLIGLAPTETLALSHSKEAASIRHLLNKKMYEDNKLRKEMS